MAEARRKRTSPIMAFILGALLFGVAVLTWFLFAGREEKTVEVPSVTIEAPKLPDIKMPDAPKLPRG